ncbi:MAG: hypothetical protein WCW14_01805 [Candidatus Paceibacterota bacterium]|jgi:hypothetical protein
MKEKAVGHSTLECLKHFCKNAGFDTHDRAMCRVRDGVSSLLGIDTGTGYCLFTKFRMPQGEKLMRLQVFLELLGYVLVEREKLDMDRKNLTDLVVFRLLTIAEISRGLRIGEDTVHRLLSGRTENIDHHLTKMKELWAIYGNDVVVAKMRWSKKIGGLGLDFIGEQFIGGLSPFDKRPILTEAARLINELLPFAKRIVSDEFTPPEREELRRLTTDGRVNGVFDLSNVLTALCGERARAQTKSGGVS